MLIGVPDKGQISVVISRPSYLWSSALPLVQDDKHTVGISEDYHMGRHVPNLNEFTVSPSILRLLLYPDVWCYASGCGDNTLGVAGLIPSISFYHEFITIASHWFHWTAIHLL